MLANNNHMIRTCIALHIHLFLSNSCKNVLSTLSDVRHKSCCSLCWVDECLENWSCDARLCQFWDWLWTETDLNEWESKSHTIAQLSQTWTTGWAESVTDCELKRCKLSNYQTCKPAIAPTNWFYFIFYPYCQWMNAMVCDGSEKNELNVESGEWAALSIRIEKWWACYFFI